MIGVLTQPLTDELIDDPRFAGKSSFIQGSYINFINSFGGRAVPLIFGDDINETLAMLDNLNGVFYCGGDNNHSYLEFGR